MVHVLCLEYCLAHKSSEKLVNDLTWQVISLLIPLTSLPRKHFLFRENLFHGSLLLAVLGVPWPAAASLQSLPVSLMAVFTVCVSDFPLLSLIRALVLGGRVHPNSMDGLTLTSFGTSAKTLVPTNVMFIGTGGQAVGVSFWRTQLRLLRTVASNVCQESRHCPT